MGWSCTTIRRAAPGDRRTFGFICGKAVSFRFAEQHDRGGARDHHGTVNEAVAITFDVPASYSVSVSAPGYVAQSREITVPRIGNGCIQITTQQATFKLVRAIPFMSTVGR